VKENFNLLVSNVIFANVHIHVSVAVLSNYCVEFLQCTVLKTFCKSVVHFGLTEFLSTSYGLKRKQYQLVFLCCQGIADSQITPCSCNINIILLMCIPELTKSLLAYWVPVSRQ